MSGACSDWLHCNSCFRLPAQCSGFFFTSCGHVICKTCSQDGKAKVCGFCKKGCCHIEVNSKTRQDISSLFRNPRDLATQFIKTLGTVLQFQSQNRAILTKHREEKDKKMMKFCQGASGELKKQQEAEKTLRVQLDKLRVDYDQEHMVCEAVKSELAAVKAELDRVRRQHFRSPSTDSGMGDSTSTSSFLAAIATSTPNHSRNDGSCSNELRNIFVSANGSVPSPIPPSFAIQDLPQLSTPDMLGLKKRRSRSTGHNEHKTKAFEMAFLEEPMDTTQSNYM